eukprot:scpid70791/ scgid20853/ E3 ubiquitin-protein ligase TRIM56; Tripartite motif-containing protein 56
MSVLVMDFMDSRQHPSQKHSSDSGYYDEEASKLKSITTSRDCLKAVASRTNYANCCQCSSSGQLRCRDCMVMLCATHAEEHKKSNATAGHLIESEEDRVKSDARCVFHEHQSITGFCETCQIGVCGECPCATKSVHKVVTINKAARDRRESLESLMTTTRSLALEELLSSKQRVATRKSAMLKQRSQLQDRIQSFYAKQMEMLQREQAFLLDQVSAVTNHNMEKLSSQRESLQAVLCSTTSSLDFTRCALSLSSDQEILAMHGPLSSRLYSMCNTSVHAGRMEPSLCPLPELKVNDESVDQLEELMTTTGLATLECEEEGCLATPPTPTHSASTPKEQQQHQPHQQLDRSSLLDTEAQSYERSNSDASANRRHRAKESTFVRTTSLTLCPS